jgi:pimeloyl-ACP methyl ester carboxylesterase
VTGSRRVAYADGELSALAWGRPEAAAALLLLHPANLRGRSWELVAGALGDGAFCLAPDLRGHGDSTRRGPFAVAGWAAESLRLLDEQGIQGVHLVGASVGAAIAVELATAHPDRVSSVTTLGGAFLPVDPDRDPLLAALRADGLDAGLAREMAEGALTAAAPSGLAERIREDVSLNPAAVASAIWQAALATDVRPVLARLTTTCLVLNGELDDVCPPADAHWFAAQVGAEARILPGRGHLLLYEAPELVAAAITAELGASA